MKKYSWLTILMALVLMLGSFTAAHAEIIPPRGEGQIGLSAAILCEELSVRQAPSGSAQKVTTARYGDILIVMSVSDGWAYCALGDSEDSPMGWVNMDYIAIDPAMYRTESKTPVYAWNSTSAYKVALLSKNTTLPILKEEGDWLLVSLRGAVGWIHK